MQRRGQQFRIALLGGKHATRLTCSEARCLQYERGWLTIVDERTDMGRKQAHYIRTESRRGFVEFRSEDAGAHLDGETVAIPDGMTVFKFYAGQQCFGTHEDREVVFVHQKRDVRRVHSRPLDFNEHFNEEAAKLAEAAERG